MKGESSKTFKAVEMKSVIYGEYDSWGNQEPDDEFAILLETNPILRGKYIYQETIFAEIKTGEWYRLSYHYTGSPYSDYHYSCEHWNDDDDITVESVSDVDYLVACLKLEKHKKVLHSIIDFADDELDRELYKELRDFRFAVLPKAVDNG